MAAVTKKVLPHRRREDESGQEPVSGVEGQRGSPPPYDAGNQQDILEMEGDTPQPIDSNETPVPKTSANDWTTTSQSAGSNSEQPAEAASNGTSGDYESKKATTSKWFADPFSQETSGSGAPAEQSVDPKGPSPEQEQATAGAEMKDTERSAAPPTHGRKDVQLDPRDFIVEPSGQRNHLGVDVPAGQFSPPMDKGKGKARRPDTELTDYETSSAASNRSGSMFTYTTAGTGASTLGSPSRRQSSLSSPNKGGVPTAGGIEVGSGPRQMRQEQKIEKKEMNRQRMKSIEDEQRLQNVNSITNANTRLNSGAGSSSNIPALSTRAPAGAPPNANQPTQNARTASADSTAPVPADSNGGRRKSSIFDKAKDVLGRTFSQRKRPSR